MSINNDTVGVWADGWRVIGLTYTPWRDNRSRRRQPFINLG